MSILFNYNALEIHLCKSSQLYLISKRSLVVKFSRLTGNMHKGYPA